MHEKGSQLTKLLVSRNCHICFVSSHSDKHARLFETPAFITHIEDGQFVDARGNRYNFAVAIDRYGQEITICE